MNQISSHYKHKHIQCLLIDLDDTLYPHTSGVWEMIRVRINQFLLDEMHFSADEAERLRARLWKQYGTTLRGLQKEYSVDTDAYLQYVHDLPLETVLAPDPVLMRIFDGIPQRKVIFTNADSNHARRVLDLLGVADHISQVIDIHDIAPYCKPEPAAFHKALKLIKENFRNCLLIDDSPANLDTAQKLGLRTVSVGQRRHDSSPHIETIHGLPDIFTC